MASVLIVGLVLTGALAARAAGQSPPGVTQCATTHWVGAWTADPGGALGAGYANQTLRVILSPHVGGSQLRVHISNRFGRQPVAFARASVALRQAGAGLVAGSSRPLRFAGQPGVIVPAGAEATSDPAALTYGAFQDLAVSLYLPEASGPATGHYIARQHSYATALASGDHTGQETADAFLTSTSTAAYVDGVDAMVPSSIGAAVLFGDSIIDGYESGGAVEDQTGIDQNHRFPDYLARRLLAEPGGPRLSVLNAGISGNRLLSDGQQGLAGRSGLSRLDSDVLGVAGVTDAIVLEGTNDVAAKASADQTEAALAQLVARLHGRGLHVLLGTLTPSGPGVFNLGSLLPAIFIDSSATAVRVAVNGWIRSGASGADGIVDFDAALHSAAITKGLDPMFDSGDHLHPNHLGYEKMADAVDLSALRGAQCAAAAPRLATALHVHVRVRSSPRRLYLTGRLTGSPDCTGTRVAVRALRGGRTIFRRHLHVTAMCRFSARRTLAQPGRIEIRARFPGSATLLPAKARPVFARAR